MDIATTTNKIIKQKKCVVFDIFPVKTIRKEFLISNILEDKPFLISANVVPFFYLQQIKRFNSKTPDEHVQNNNNRDELV